MRKTFTLATMLILAMAGYSQIVPVSYRGAFAPAPTPMWTDGWSEWNPQDKVYPSTTVNISGAISSNTTWTANNVYLLSGVVTIDTLITLTIEPGTVIRGNDQVANSCLIVRRGAKLIAAGTPCKPIVFTSNKPVGSRAPGDWGGVIVLGRAPLNTPATATALAGTNFIEGLAQTPATQYGGASSPVPDDNSGVLSYVRIEFGGYVFQPNVEINGLTLGAVGSATTLDHIQCSFNNDDSFEWFGGTVNASYLVAYRGIDDNWDTDFGFNGSVQFCLGVRDPDLFDPTYAATSGGSTSEGFESDNDGGGSTNEPKTAAVFSNVTDIGPFRGSTSNPIGPGFRRSVRLRRNTETKIFNSVLMDFPTGLFVDGSAAQNNYLGDLLKFSNNLIAGTQTGRVMESGTPANIRAKFGSSNNDSLVSTAGILVKPYDYFEPDYRPASASPLLSNVNFSDPVLVARLSPINAITPVAYRGAFAPAPTPMWTDGWTEWNPQDKVYPSTTVNISGAISSNTTWTANNVYLLSGVVTIDTLITLTIEPGTVIRGNDQVANSCLIVRRGAKLIAAGTPCKPIVFTSNKPVGSRAPGDWGGVIVLGRGPLNTPATATALAGTNFIEGLAQTPATQYGGASSPVPDDNSGVLSYMRIEFGGYVFQPNVEINGLTLGAVGSATTLDHIQCSFNNDDSFEWFGGTVNAKYLVAYRGIDDNWDTDFGFNGKVQFGLGVRDPDLFDPTYAATSGGSTSEGFESDNDGGGSTNQPKTAAVFSNVTDIGPFRGSTSNPIGPGFRRSVRLRRNTETKIFNSLMMDFPTGLFVDGSAAQNNYLGDLLKFSNNLIAGTQTGRVMESGTPANIRAKFGASSNDSLASTAGILIRPYDYFNPDYRPTESSPLLSNYSFSDPALPVVLATFEGVTSKNIHYLNWETRSEINNRGFELQRSADGRNYSTIANIGSKAPNGNSTQSISYSFIDSRPLPGFSYYRLRQTDANGKETYSRVVVLKIDEVQQLSISLAYPNPVKHQLNMVVLSPGSRSLTLSITDLLGRTLTSRTISIQKGSNIVQMNTANLKSGSYLIKAMDATGEATEVKQFIKQ